MLIHHKFQTFDPLGIPLAEIGFVFPVTVHGCCFESYW